MPIVMLGRQPLLGIAELESLYGNSIEPINDYAVVVSEPVDIRRLGGAIKIAEHIDSVNASNHRTLISHLQKHISRYCENYPKGKIKLGVSYYGIDISTQNINASNLTLKKTLKKTGRSVRVVPNQTTELSSAQAIHNQLTSNLGLELIILRSGSEIIIAKTTQVQDIDDYTRRDRGRPKRDARVGMLPPKLAQIMINFASPLRIEDNQWLLDPFCGTGVVLQESSLMGYSVYGTDIDERMINYSEQNSKWLRALYPIHTNIKLEAGSATTHTWKPSPHVVVSELYLGTPFTTPPSKDQLHEVMHECNTLLKQFLTHISAQLHDGTKLALAVPAWHIHDTIYHLPAIDDLEKLGYTQVKFSHIDRSDLVYRREGQVVGRKLLVLKRSNHVKS